MARMDSRDALNYVRERARSSTSSGSTTLQPALPPEEVQTFNLVRRLASSHARRGGRFAAALHTKGLEGGNRRLGIPPSGADLELALQLPSGDWLDLILQAKRQFSNGQYMQWESWQVTALRAWARSRGRSPGILLYNAPISPFGPPQTWVTMGACCRTHLRCSGRRWPTWLPPDNRSPLAITICMLEDEDIACLLRDRPDVNYVNRHAMLFECLLCPSRPPSVLSSRHTPQWAAALLESASALESSLVTDEQANVDEPLNIRALNDWVPRYSLVLAPSRDETSNPQLP